MKKYIAIVFAFAFFNLQAQTEGNKFVTARAAQQQHSAKPDSLQLNKRMPLTFCEAHPEECAKVKTTAKENNQKGIRKEGEVSPEK